jgi:FKBP12-rapamycin complex-associated protein
MLSRSNSVVVRVQMLSELEEIIAYKQWHDQPSRQAIQRKVWMKRYVQSLCGGISLRS